MMGWSDGWFVTSFLIVGVHLVVCRALTLLLMSLRTYLSFKLHEIPRDVEEGSRSPAHVEVCLGVGAHVAVFYMRRWVRRILGVASSSICWWGVKGSSEGR